MPSFTSPAYSVSASTLRIVTALGLLAFEGKPAGATYDGLRFFLGTRTDSGIRRAVRVARASGFVTVTHTADGRGGKALVRLTPKARTLLLRLTRKEVSK